MHCDLSFSSDSTGVAMGYVDGFKDVTRRNEEGKSFRGASNSHRVHAED